MDIRSDKAWRLEGGETVQVDPETVRVADHILVKPGEKVPLDGLVREGRSILDTSALTGESLPREIGVGEDITSGVINLTSPLVIEVSKTFSQSTVNKILELACKPASLAWFRGVVDLALSGTYLFSHFLPLCSCGFGTNEFLWRARGSI